MIDGLFFRFVLVPLAENCRFDGAPRDFDKIPRILFSTVTVIDIKWRTDKILWEFLRGCSWNFHDRNQTTHKYDNFDVSRPLEASILTR